MAKNYFKTDFMDIDFDNISINGKKYKDWSEDTKKSFWDGFDSNKLGNPDKYPFPELRRNNNNYSSNTNKGDWKTKLGGGDPDTDEGRWVTLKNHQHIFIKDSYGNSNNNPSLSSNSSSSYSNNSNNN